MSGICERLGVKFPGPTRRSIDSLEATKKQLLLRGLFYLFEIGSYPLVSGLSGP